MVTTALRLVLLSFHRGLLIFAFLSFQRNCRFANSFGGLQADGLGRCCYDHGVYYFNTRSRCTAHFIRQKNCLALLPSVEIEFPGYLLTEPLLLAHLTKALEP